MNRVLILVVLVASPLGCTKTYQVAPVSFARPEQLGNATNALGATLGAGLLPIQVVFRNDGDRSLEINGAQTFLEDAQENLWPILEERIAYERASAGAAERSAFKQGVHEGFLGAAAGAVVGAAVGAATVGTGAGAADYVSGEARREIVDDLRGKSLERKPIEPGSIVHGFIFFPGEASDARLLRLQVRDRRTGQVGTVERRL